MIFRKLEFLPAEWEALKPLIQKEVNMHNGVIAVWDTDKVHIVAELPPICTAWEVNAEGIQVCTQLSDKVAVDIVFVNEMPAEFAPYLVWPTPGGLHSFAGLEGIYEAAYNERMNNI